MECKLTNDNQAKPYPARSKAKPKDGEAQPTIIVDSREQRPLSEYFTLPTVTAALPTGDYSVVGLEDRVAVERKSPDDLVSCLMGDNRARFERELQRGRSLDLFAVVVEAELSDLMNGRYTSKMIPKAVVQSIIAFQARYGTPFWFVPGRKAAARLVESILEKYVCELRKRLRAVERGPVPMDLPGVDLDQTEDPGMAVNQ